MHALAAIESEHGSLSSLEERNAFGSERGAYAQLYATSVGPAPCETCPRSKDCGERVLACRAFYQYAEVNRWDADKRVNPTRAMYRLVMASS